MKNFFIEFVFIVNCIISVLLGTTALFQIDVLSKAVTIAALVSASFFLILGSILPTLSLHAPHLQYSYCIENPSIGSSSIRNTSCLNIYLVRTRTILGILALLFFAFIPCATVNYSAVCLFFFYLKIEDLLQITLLGS